MSPLLLPCPFCANIADLETETGFLTPAYFVQCQTCGAKGSRHVTPLANPVNVENTRRAESATALLACVSWNTQFLSPPSKWSLDWSKDYPSVTSAEICRGVTITWVKSAIGMTETEEKEAVTFIKWLEKAFIFN